MVNKQIKLVLATLALTSIFSLSTFPKEAKAYTSGGDGIFRINSWDVDTFNDSKDLWVQSRDAYNPEKVKDRVVSGDFDGNGKDEIAAFYDYGNARTEIHRYYEKNGEFVAPTAWNSGVGNFNANSINNKVVSGDFNGDGKDEIVVLYDYFNSTVKMYQFSLQSDGQTFKDNTVWNSAGFVGANVAAMVAGDFDGDKKDEILIFYDYGNAKTGMFELKMGSDGIFKDRYVWESNSYNANNIKGKTVAGDFDGNGKDEVAMFYDYGNAKTKIFTVYNSNNTYLDKTTWQSNSFLASRIDGKVISTNNGNGVKDKIIALYDYGNNVTGVFSLEMTNNTIFTDKKSKELNNYEADRVKGMVVGGKFDGTTNRLAALYDGLTVSSLTNQQRIVNEALYWVGKIPYRIPSSYNWQTGILDRNNWPSSMDCSDFTSAVYATTLGIRFQDWTGTQKNLGSAVDISGAKSGNYGNLVPGDLIIFTWPGGSTAYGDHVGIYIGNGQIVHESGTNETGGNVKVNYLNENWGAGYGVIRNNIISIRRII